MVAENPQLALIERVLERPVAAATPAVWGFTSRAALVIVASGDQVVVQRYRRREDAACRLRVMRALWKPAAEAGIAIPRVRQSSLDADPPWVMFAALHGVPSPRPGRLGWRARDSQPWPGRWASWPPASSLGPAAGSAAGAGELRLTFAGIEAPGAPGRAGARRR